MNNIATIYNIVNPKNNKSYIGSSINFETRKKVHLNMLSKNEHPNLYLQRAFNLLEDKTLQFNKLAICPKEYQFKLEQWFLDNMNPVYNIARNVSEIHREKLNEEVKEKMSISAKLKYITHPEIRKSLSLSTTAHLKERWKNPIFAEKMKNMNSGENHPQAKITANIARLIKIDIQNNIPKKITINTHNITSHIYQSIKSNKSWKNIIF